MLKILCSISKVSRFQLVDLISTFIAPLCINTMRMHANNSYIKPVVDITRIYFLTSILIICIVFFAVCCVNCSFSVSVVSALLSFLFCVLSIVCYCYVNNCNCQLFFSIKATHFWLIMTTQLLEVRSVFQKSDACHECNRLN